MVAPSRYKVEEDTLSKGMLKDLIDRADLKRLAGKPKESFDAVTNVRTLIRYSYIMVCVWPNARLRCDAWMILVFHATLHNEIFFNKFVYTTIAARRLVSACRQKR